MIHYHGTPITPRDRLLSLAGRNFCVSFARADDVRVCHEVGQSVMLDNGAFSFWRRARGIAQERAKDTGWERWERWADRWLDYQTTWCVLPDVIDGGPELNDELLARYAHVRRGAPVWHLDEPLDRLRQLVEDWPRVCFGSSGLYAVIGTDPWHRRVAEAFDAIAAPSGRIGTWIHMLRGMKLAGDVYPFASVDSTDVGRNHNRIQNTAAEMAARWDAIQCPARWTHTGQLTLEEVVA